MVRILLAACLLAFSVALAHGQTSSITLDAIPDSAYVGDVVTFTGTLHLDGRNPEGAVVHIKDEDTFSGDDLLASAYVDSDGRFVARWIAEDVDPDIFADVYAVFEGDYASQSARSPEQRIAVLTYGGSLVLDSIPQSAAFGESVTMSGTLYLDGRNPEGAVVYIKEEDSFSGDDLLASAYVGSDGRFNTYWIAEDIDPTNDIEVYAVFEGNARFNRLVSDIHHMSLYFDPLVPDPTPPVGDGYMKLYYSMDLVQAPRVLIAPSPNSYDEVRKHIIPVQEGIIELTAMLEREYEDGVWDVSFEVLDRGRPFASEEPDIVVSIVTGEEDPQCGVDYSGVAWPDNVKPVQARVCSLEEYSDAYVNAIAAHEFIHAIGLGHTFDIARDMMCSVENDIPTCDDLRSKSNTPSSLNLAAIVAVYGTDGFSNPNNGIVRNEVFTIGDYQSRNHLRLPQDQDYPMTGYPVGYIFAGQWQHRPGEEVFLDGFHFVGYDAEATVTIEDPHGNIDAFAVSVVDGYFSVYADGYHLSGTYIARSYDHRGDFVASTTFDVTEDIPGESDGWFVLTDADQYYSGSAMQISGYGPQSYYGQSRVLIADQDGSVVDDLSVYPVAGYFTVTAYLSNSYQPGTYGVWFYDGAGSLITYTTFTLTAPEKDTGAIVINAMGSSVPGCEETDECFIPSVVTVDVGGEVAWINEDVAAHTITSGILADGGPDGVFDSGLFVSETTFAHTFDSAGVYPYFCMVHPWMSGLVIVQDT